MFDLEVGFDDDSLLTGVDVGGNIDTPPVMPYDVYVRTSDALATISWINGIESDLAGTSIQYSSGNEDAYAQIADIPQVINLEDNPSLTNYYTHYVGYFNTGYFTLANYNKSDIVSEYTTGVYGITSTTT